MHTIRKTSDKWVVQFVSPDDTRNIAWFRDMRDAAVFASFMNGGDLDRLTTKGWQDLIASEVIFTGEDSDLSESPTGRTNIDPRPEGVRSGRYPAALPKRKRKANWMNAYTGWRKPTSEPTTGT